MGALDHLKRQNYNEEHKQPFLLAVFDLMLSLISSPTTDIAINSVLEQMGRFFHVSRVYIFENSLDGKYLSNTYEWCNDGITSVMANLQNMNLEQDWSMDIYDSNGLFFCDDITKLDPALRSIIEPQGIKSLLHCSIRSGDETRGLIGFDENSSNRIWTAEEVEGLIAAARIVSNIILRKQAENDTERMLHIMRTVLDNISSLIYVAHLETFELLFVNKALTNILPNKNPIGTKCYITLHGRVAPCPFCPRKHLLDGKGKWISEPYIWEFLNTTVNRWYAITDTIIDWVDGNKVHFENAVDITTKKKAELAIKHMAYHDYLLDIPNRAKLHEDMTLILDGSGGNSLSGALFFCDLDDFKFVNDVYGHECGDNLLVVIANFLASMTTGDTPGNVYRYGGDEFIIVMKGCTVAQATATAERIIARFGEKWQLGERKIYATTSLGITMFPHDGTTAEELLQKGDMAMYQAKRNGKNNYMFYSTQMTSNLHERTMIESLLHLSVSNNFAECQLHYLPLFDVASRTLRGAEALMRLKKKNGDLIMPSNFIALAESLGLIKPLGDWALCEACEVCRRWIDLSGKTDLFVSVNISAKQLYNSEFFDQVMISVNNAGITPANLMLEITEEVALFDIAAALIIMEKLRFAGFRLALDDFGTGLSSFGSVRRLPLDIIKIDNTLIAEMASGSEQSESLFSSMVSLVHSLGVSVCCEGVETELQYNIASHHKAEYVQGFLLGAPCSEEDFVPRFFIE